MTDNPNTVTIPVNLARALWQLEGCSFGISGEEGHSIDCMVRNVWRALLGPSQETVTTPIGQYA